MQENNRLANQRFSHSYCTTVQRPAQQYPPMNFRTRLLRVRGVIKIITSHPPAISCQARQGFVHTSWTSFPEGYDWVPSVSYEMDVQNADITWSPGARSFNELEYRPQVVSLPANRTRGYCELRARVQGYEELPLAPSSLSLRHHAP